MGFFSITHFLIVYFRTFQYINQLSVIGDKMLGDRGAWQHFGAKRDGY